MGQPVPRRSCARPRSCIAVPYVAHAACPAGVPYVLWWTPHSAPCGGVLPGYTEASVNRPQRRRSQRIQRIRIVKRCNGCSSRSGAPSSLQQFRRCAQRHGRSRPAQRRGHKHTKLACVFVSGAAAATAGCRRRTSPRRGTRAHTHTCAHTGLSGDCWGAGADARGSTVLAGRRARAGTYAVAIPCVCLRVPWRALPRRGTALITE